ncbi:hypothetical protein LTR28_011913, partial [Elasticomyces elasticus]
GTFLFSRITSDNGTDSRFENIRSSPPKFLGAFFAQATWVSLCLLPVLALNSIPATTLSVLPFLKLTDIIGIALYIGGLGFEATADAQKSKWMEEKKQKKHSEEFLTHGLWSKSRHPNYFGESTLWTGIATVAGGVLLSNVGQAGMGFAGGLAGKIGALAMAGVSPAFVTFLLLKVSGVPLSENKYDKRYGDREDYQQWKKNTPMFIPKLYISWITNLKSLKPVPIQFSANHKELASLLDAGKHGEDRSEKEQGAMSKRLSEMSDETLETGGKSARKAIEEAGFDEQLRKKLEERIANASFRSENASAFAQAELPSSAGR